MCPGVYVRQKLPYHFLPYASKHASIVRYVLGTYGSRGPCLDGRESRICWQSFITRTSDTFIGNGDNNLKFCCSMNIGNSYYPRSLQLTFNRCESWTGTQKDNSRIQTNEMIFLSKVKDYTILDRYINEDVRQELMIFSMNHEVNEYETNWKQHAIDERNI